jgi:murein DD-endopeptidase MepM/ murein hydrolase activator NlpD
MRESRLTWLLPVVLAGVVGLFDASAVIAASGTAGDVSRPARAQRAGTPARQAPAPGSVARATHVVQRGDTLSGIAQQYGVSVRTIVRANQLRSQRASLRVGSQLAIPQVHRAIGTVEPAERGRQRSQQAAKQPRVRRAAAVATAPKMRTPPENLVLAIPDVLELSPAFAWPVDGELSSAFGLRRRGWHRGVDIFAPPGTQIVAAAPGLVVASGIEGRYGRVVKIAHDHGFLTVYAHNAENLVELGDWVSAGQPIATVGRTGRATAEHVHFEIRQDGRVYNPLYLLPMPPRIAQIDEQELETDEADEEHE